MCSRMCTHFHATTNKNEEYIKELLAQQNIHTFLCNGVTTVVLTPFGYAVESVHVSLKGKVQGKRFLLWVGEHAMLMTLNGWVRHLKDGSVEAVFAGKPAAVDRMLEMCKTGPSHSHVTEIVATKCDPPPGAGFQLLPKHDPEKVPAGGEKIGKPKVMRRRSSKFKLKKEEPL